MVAEEKPVDDDDDEDNEEDVDGDDNVNATSPYAKDEADSGFREAPAKLRLSKFPSGHIVIHTHGGSTQFYH